MKGCANLIGTLLMGLVVGVIARFLLPGGDRLNILWTIVLGIAGSFVGGFLYSVFDKKPGTEFKPVGFLMSVVGAILLLIVYRMMN